MRYTEARLKPLGDDMMADLDEETVDFVPNYDETTEEPTVLPTPFPNLLVNGSAGIAVGMATNIPPHNLREVIDGCIWLIENTHFAEAGARPTTVEKLRNLIRLIPAPDLPTAGQIVGRQAQCRRTTEQLDPHAREVRIETSRRRSPGHRHHRIPSVAKRS